MPLSRDEILKYEEPSRRVLLPSGVKVNIRYLAYLLVLKLFDIVKEEEDKEKVFAERVIRLLLRENEQQDIYSFTREDQIKLIEIAVQEWGCKEEFDKLPDSLEVEVRFYQAATKKNFRFHDELTKRMKHIGSSISNVVIPRFDWFEDYHKSLREVTEQLTAPLTNQLSEVISGINNDTFEQFSKLGQHATQISGLDDLLKTVSKAITIPYEESLISRMGDALSNYHSVMDNLALFDNFIAMPEIERYYPSLEMKNLSIAANVALSTDELTVIDEVITPESDDLIVWLSSLDPVFPDILKGAEQTITSRNTDRCRHFASSHRELSNHILHHFAPDDDVEDWTDDPNHFHEGRPTRKARLLFIARDSNNQPFVNFFVSSFLAQMDLLNADQHRRHQDYTERDLRLLHQSFLSTLSMFMEIILSDSMN